MERIKSEELPIFVSSQLLTQENVYYFSFITFKGGCGCSGVKTYNLKIASSGTMVIIPIPTEAKAYEIRKAYMELLELQKDSKKNEYNE